MKDLKEKLSIFLKDNINNIILINSWFLSQWYKVFWNKQNYFIRTIIKKTWWFEYDIEDKKSFNISHNMQKKDIWWLNSYWVLKYNNQFYHITDYFEWNILWLTDMTKENIIEIANIIWNLHINWKKILSNFSSEELKIYYKRGLREIITNPETLFSLYEWYIIWNQDEVFFQKLIDKMLKTYFKLIKNFDENRLTTIHWDFWQGNILINNNWNIKLIDFSRIPFWEPWIDIGRFITQFDIEYIINNDINILKLKELFLEQYLKITKDKDILNYTELSRLWVCFIQLSHLTQGFLKRDEDKITKIQNWALK